MLLVRLLFEIVFFTYLNWLCNYIDDATVNTNRDCVLRNRRYRDSRVITN